MEELLQGGTRKLYPAAENRKAWDAIPEKYRQEIRVLGKQYAGISYPERSASGFLAFARTGDRQADENRTLPGAGNSVPRSFSAVRFRTPARRT